MVIRFSLPDVEGWMVRESSTIGSSGGCDSSGSSSPRSDAAWHTAGHYARAAVTVQTVVVPPKKVTRLEDDDYLGENAPARTVVDDSIARPKSQQGDSGSDCSVIKSDVATVTV